MKKILPLLIIILLALLLSSCTTPGDKDTPDSSTDGSTTTESATSEPATTEPVFTYIELISDGVCVFKLVRPDDASTDIVNAVMTLRDRFEEKFGVKISIISDWDKNNKQNATVESGPEVHEILIGDTNRAESRAMAESAAENKGSYIIRMVNGKLVVWGSDINLLLLAIDRLPDSLAITMKEDFETSWSLSGEGSIGQRLMTEYTVIRSSTSPERVTNAVGELRSMLKELTGLTIPQLTDAKAASGKEILVGDTKRDESIALADELTYMDYTIRITSDKILIQGGSPLATEQAVHKFVELIEGGKLDSLDAGFEYSWRFKDVRPDSVIFNIDSFVPVWANKYTPAAWMLDFSEKVYACVCPTGRMMGDAHRGDHQNYPENSAEGILSAVMMGADCIEIDPRLTKDGILVLMHDETLTRTTDFAEKKGKNGLPTSPNVCDWTYEQLLQLNLRDGMGKNTAVTEYKICTAYEAVAIMAGKCLIHWDCKDQTVVRDSDTFLLAAELGAKANFYYYYNDTVMKNWVSLDTTDKEFSDFVAEMAALTSQSGFKRRSRNFDYIEKFGDDLNGWNQHIANGCRMVFTNKIYDMCKYIAANESPISR